MEPILKSILENKTENYLLPFFWQHDGHDAEIPARVQKIYDYYTSTETLARLVRHLAA